MSCYNTSLETASTIVMMQKLWKLDRDCTVSQRHCVLISKATSRSMVCLVSRTKSSDTEMQENHNWRHLCRVASRAQTAIVHPRCASPLLWRQFKDSRVSLEKKKEKKKRMWKPSKCNRGVGMRLRSRWFPPPVLMRLILILLLLIVLSLHPRLSYDLHSRCRSRLRKWHTLTMTCWKNRRSCSSLGLPWKQAQQGLSNAERL